MPRPPDPGSPPGRRSRLYGSICLSSSVLPQSIGNLTSLRLSRKRIHPGLRRCGSWILHLMIPAPFPRRGGGKGSVEGRASLDVTALRPLAIGEILDGAFTLYRRNFFKLYLTQVLIVLPSIALGFTQSQLASLV